MENAKKRKGERKGVLPFISPFFIASLLFSSLLFSSLLFSSLLFSSLFSFSLFPFPFSLFPFPSTNLLDSRGLWAISKKEMSLDDIQMFPSKHLRRRRIFFF
ncbi:hypothetical protein GM920_13660 [Pedobacter sp. LMG 31462]|uniref:Transmembrane protein n=1 Tax=Pedobacter gandavensis TaxID=2679963 RepID=A0ABR6EXD3_9SPHI|nr:hypothetical protein [Pedobacter gandavensis]